MISLPSFSMPALSSIGSSESVSKVLKMAAPIGSVVISSIVLIFVVWPTFSRIINLNITNKQLSIRAAGLEAKVQSLNSLDQNLLDRQLSASEQLLPSDKGVFSIVSQIEREASAAGVVLDKVDVAPGSVGDSLTLSQSQETNTQPTQRQTASSGQGSADLGSLAVSTPQVQLKIAVSSDYQGLLRFINGLYSVSRIVSIHDLTIVSSGSGSGITTQLIIDAFWAPIPRELPAVETPIVFLTDSELAILQKVSPGEGGVGIAAGGEGVSVPTGKSDIFAPF